MTTSRNSQSFSKEAQLDWAGFFAYSAEVGTPFADYDGQIDNDEKNERLRYLSSIQEDIAAVRNAGQAGQVLEVLIDQVEDGQPVGRSYREAPAIDGVILLDNGTPGDWVTARITGGCNGTDLIATVEGPAPALMPMASPAVTTP